MSSRLSSTTVCITLLLLFISHGPVHTRAYYSADPAVRSLHDSRVKKVSILPSEAVHTTAGVAQQEPHIASSLVQDHFVHGRRTIPRI